MCCRILQNRFDVTTGKQTNPNKYSVKLYALYAWPFFRKIIWKTVSEKKTGFFIASGTHVERIKNSITEKADFV